jgi:uncharacterized protein
MTIKRRDLLKIGGAAAAGLMIGRASSAAGEPPRPVPGMPARNLGRTGVSVKLFSLGGQAAIERSNNAAVAVPLIERALDLGVNYVDTSARYGGDERWSERYFGEALGKRRGQVVLATKTHDRTRDGSLRILDRSLELLKTDRIDLWQIHNLANMGEVERIFAKGGAIEALLEAREKKIVRFLGVTGHADPDVLLEAIRRFPFDTLLLALNAADRYRLPFAAKLLPAAVEKEMGIIGMKIPARGKLLGRKGLTMGEALRYVLTLPVSTVIVGCDSIDQLEENVAIATEFTPYAAEQMTALEGRAERNHRESLFFRRWDA